MPFDIASSSVIAEFSSGAGTVAYVLDGPLPRAAAFSEFFAIGEAVAYEADDQGGQIEYGSGLFDGTTISRDAVRWSTTGGLIDWPADGRRIIKATVAVALQIYGA